MNLPENCMITIRGTMEQGDDNDTVELMTRGYFTHRDGNYYITYKESETTGYEGCTTTLKVSEDSHQVSMLRHGPMPSQLIIEKGVRHVCHYETGYGSMNLGVSADEITHALGEDGGDIHFSYTLDSGNEALLSRTLVQVTVKSLLN